MDVETEPAVKKAFLLFTAVCNFSIIALPSIGLSCGLAVREAVKKVFLVDYDFYRVLVTGARSLLIVSVFSILLCLSALG